MTWVKEIMNDENLKADMQTFYNNFGISGLKRALKFYTDMQQEYICRTKTSMTRICIEDIYYLEILKHDITVHTVHGVYHKYGTLNKELKVLAPYGFVRCHQSFIVSISKIKSIVHDDIILVNGTKIHISKNYIKKIILVFSKRNSK